MAVSDMAKNLADEELVRNADETSYRIAAEQSALIDPDSVASAARHFI